MTTAEKIKTIRKALKLTQAAFAENLKVGSSCISDIEKGNKHPSASLVSLLKLQYRVSPLWWETGAGPMFVAGDLSDVRQSRKDQFESILLVEEPELSIHHRVILKLFDAVDPDTQDEVVNMLLEKVSRKKEKS